MNTISQRCPKCGTYVQMESHTAIGDDTKSLLKGAVKVGTSVATEFTEVGGTYGRIISGLANLAIDSIPENYYKYHCPKCGYTWRNLSQNASENTGFVSLKDVPCIENNPFRTASVGSYYPSKDSLKCGYTRRNLSQNASENTGFVSLKDVPYIENNLFRTASENTGFVSLKVVPCIENNLSGNVTSNDTGGEESDTDYSSSEQEYIEEIKYCLEEDEEISPRERRLLEKLRIKLGITEERAKELEESLLPPALTDDEKEYLEEYKECAADGEITAKDRRLLDKLRKMLGISEERAKELETL